ncbi:hypothetical protein WL29_20430 [Burkholderia ubonensis]|uniref:Uncharacterized protein n=2 Tax=Burkholderia ubonensis TaxID=101571 RepID=A0A106QC41_9BURK|nr:hypothetical protein WL29_20430 [Burkholderia ubonensis]
MARANAMGFTKNGKPMVIDQAFELVAAEEGHRNQHALRAAMSVPKNVAATEKEGRDQWLLTSLRLGWDRESQIIHLEGFISQKGLMAEFGAYAEVAAKEELSLSNGEPSEKAVNALQSLGYRVVESDFKQPYWEFDDEGSTDFSSEDEAWADAWTDAQARTVAICGLSQQDWDAMKEDARIALVLEKVREAQLRKAADDAYENYDFGENKEVVCAGGWEWQLDQAIRSVFLKDRGTPDEDTKRYLFRVDFVDGKVDETCLFRPAIRG